MVLFIKLDDKIFINNEVKHMDKVSEKLKLRNVPENIDELDETEAKAALKDVNYNIKVLMGEVKKLQKSSL
jgi:hypothetical protein